MGYVLLGRWGCLVLKGEGIDYVTWVSSCMHLGHLWRGGSNRQEGEYKAGFGGCMIICFLWASW